MGPRRMALAGVSVFSNQEEKMMWLVCLRLDRASQQREQPNIVIDYV